MVICKMQMQVSLYDQAEPNPNTDRTETERSLIRFPSLLKWIPSQMCHWSFYVKRIVSLMLHIQNVRR